MRSKISALGAKLLPKNLYSRLTLITTVTFAIGYFVVYAAYQNFVSTEYESGAQLTSIFLGKVVSNLDDLNTRVSNFGFSAGNVGIGTASPGGKLNIVQTVDAPSLKIFSNQTGYLSSNQSVLSITTTNGTSNPTTSYAVTATYNGSNILHVRNDGKVGIGTASPGEKLEVYGNIRFGAIDSARQITIWTATIPSPTTCDATCVNSYCLGAYIDGTTTKATCSSTTSNRNCVCIGK